MADVTIAEPAPHSAALPAQVGKYRVLALLGRGAMGEVYLAEDPHIQRSVAVKVMRATDDEGDAARFLHEARVLGGFSHLHIVTVHDFGFQEGRPFLVMEHVAGETLGEWLAREHPLQDHLAIMEDLLGALQYAHQQGVLHRDLKPSNVRVMPDGQCKLVDFGIARAPSATLTTTGMIMGTPAYMAPEILLDALYSTSADIYSVALVLYEMLTGTNPFRARTLPATMNSVLTLRPVPLASLRPDVPPALADAIMACLEKDPRLRPRDLTALATVVGELRRMEAAGAEERPRAPRGARRVLVSTAFAAGLAALAALAALRRGPTPAVPHAAEAVVPAAALLPVAPVAPASPLPAAGAAPAAAPPAPTRQAPAARPSPGPRPTPSVAAHAALTAEAAVPEALRAAAAAVKASPALPGPQPSATPAAAGPVEAAGAAEPPPASLVALSARFVRRRTTLQIELRGTGFRPDHRVLVVRGRQEAVGIRVIRQQVVSDGLIRATLMVDEDVPLGTYSVALVDGQGRLGRRLGLEVVL